MDAGDPIAEPPEEDAGAKAIVGLDVELMLSNACGGCHFEGSKIAQVDLKSPGVADRVSGVESPGCEGFTLANPQDPNRSLLYLKVSGEDPGCGEPMPPPPIAHLSEDERRALRDWIAGLAPPAAIGTCKPRQERVCEDIGNASWWPDLEKAGDALANEMTKPCQVPKQVCSADGDGWGPCVGQFPAVEDCSTPVDEDCNLNTPAQICRENAWAISIAGEGSKSFDSVDVDVDGNVYLLGTFEGELDFGGGMQVSDEPGGQFKSDVFLGKYDSNGTYVWSKDFGDTSNQYSTQLAVDRATGDVAVVHRLFGSVEYGDGSPTYRQKGSSDFIVATFDTDGKYRWAQQFGGKALDRAERITIARDNGDVIVGGKVGASADGQMVIPSKGPVAPSGQADGLVLRLGGKLGEVKWYTLLGGEGWDCTEAEELAGDCARGDDDYVWGVDTDESGDVYVTGRFEGSFNFEALDGAPESTTAASRGQHDIFVVKLSGATGKPLWSKHFGGSKDDRAYDLRVQAGTDNVVLAGFFGGSADFGGTELTATGGAADDDFVVVSLNSRDGSTVFAKNYGDADSQFGSEHSLGLTTRSINLAIDGTGNIYVGGPLYGSWSGQVTARAGSTPKPDAFFVKLSATGEFMNGSAYGGTGSELAYDMAIDPKTESVILVGRFYSRELDLGVAGKVLGISDTASMFAAKWPQP